MPNFIFTALAVLFGMYIGGIIAEESFKVPVRAAIKTCEETLPRNQHCVIQYIAVPEEKK